jgi:hypothetical protein
MVDAERFDNARSGKIPQSIPRCPLICASQQACARWRYRIRRRAVAYTIYDEILKMTGLRKVARFSPAGAGQI